MTRYDGNPSLSLAELKEQSSCRVVRLELASEQVNWEDRQDHELFMRECDGPAFYQYLYWLEGCDPQCPRILASASS